MKIISVFLALTFIISMLNLLCKDRHSLCIEHQNLLDTYLISNNETQKKLDTLFKKNKVTNLFINPNINYEARVEQLIGHGFSLIAQKPHICRHETMPEWVIKTAPLTSNDKQRNKQEPLKTSCTLQRAIHATCISQVIKKYNLEDAIIVPEKKWYHLPEKSWTIHDKNYLVLSEYIELEPTNTCIPITKEQVRAVLIIMLKCGLIDIKPDNLWFTLDGRLALIDTEPRSLKDRLSTPVYEQETLHSQELQATIGAFRQFCDAPLLNLLKNIDPSCWDILLDV